MIFRASSNKRSMLLRIIRFGGFAPQDVKLVPKHKVFGFQRHARTDQLTARGWQRCTTATCSRFGPPTSVSPLPDTLVHRSLRYRPGAGGARAAAASIFSQR